MTKAINVGTLTFGTCSTFIETTASIRRATFEDYKGGYVQVVCIETEEVVYEEPIPADESKGINSMDDLADYINAADEWPSDVEDIIERNGWVSDTGTEFGICHDDTRRVVVNERGIAEVLDA